MKKHFRKQFGSESEIADCLGYYFVKYPMVQPLINILNINTQNILKLQIIFVEHPKSFAHAYSTLVC